MKKLFFILFLAYSNIVAAQINVGSTWKYQRFAVIYQNDTLDYFNADSAKNIYGLERIRISFKANNQYEALYFNGTKASGYWQISAANLIINTDTNAIILQNDTTLVTKGEIQYHDSSNNFSGYLISYLKKLPACDTIQSIATGDWNDPSIWSCNRVPNIDDDVIINNTHVVTLLKSMGSHNCKSITIKTGGIFIMAGKVYVKYP